MDEYYYKKYEPVFGKWKFVKQIGEGDHGKIFVIEHQHEGITDAAALKIITVPSNDSEIKSMMADGMSEDDVRNYYLKKVNDLVNELKILDRLKGNNYIANYEEYAAFKHSDQIGWDILIRMELLIPLSGYLSKRKMTPEKVTQFGIEICRALAECENNNIIHRNIKPENIFYSQSDNFKLGDFAVAKVVDDMGSVLSRKGTYTYMAPEVFRGETYDNTVDIYSLGIVMYKLLNNNRTPFLPDYPKQITYADKERSIFNRMKGDALPQPANGSAGLKSIVLKACAFQKEKRYASAKEMLNDLVSEANGIAHVADIEKKQKKTSSDHIKQDNVQIIEAKQQLEKKKHHVKNTSYSSKKKNTTNKNFNKKKRSRSRKKKITIAIFAILLIIVAACVVVMLPR